MIANWRSAKMVSRGVVHHLDELPGFAAIEGEKIVGIVTYHIEQGRCEIVSLDSFQENKGVGSQLIEQVVQAAEESGCQTVWLMIIRERCVFIKSVTL
jgi:GNAT superfamily N-acetyltransferase